MRKALKILKWVGIVLVSVIVIFVALVFVRKNRTFEAPYPDIHASKDSAVIARGKYLVLGPAHCAFCHGDTAKLGLVDQGQEVALSGGHEFKIPIGIIRSANITSDAETGIGKLTDGEIARTLRFAVAHDGHAVPDFMPFQNVSDEDLTAIISYLRTIPPVTNTVVHFDMNFLGNAVRAFVLEPMKGNGTPPKIVTADSTVDYGRYLVMSVSNCRGCHTARDMMTGKFIGPDLGGGTEFESTIDPSKKYYPPNLTPDHATGKIAMWSEKDFIERFRKGRLVPDSPMPWGPFSRMGDVELKAIYRYLRTVAAIQNLPGPKKD
jgi:mono/diheme cytochrome c family protein